MKRLTKPTKTAQRSAEAVSVRQPPLYLFTGFILGLVIGLFLSWGVFPTIVVDVPPASLADEYKSQYRAAAALAFATSGDLVRAQLRLALLEDPDVVRALVSQAQLTLLDDEAQREARALSQLATALDQRAADLETEAAEGDPLGVSTPGSADSPAPGYLLRDQQLQCAAGDPLLKIFVYDASGDAQSGAHIVARSSERQDEFFTGLKPEISPGYADFVMTPGVVYSISVGGFAVVNPLQAAACELPDGESSWGSWQLIVDAQ